MWHLEASAIVLGGCSGSLLSGSLLSGSLLSGSLLSGSLLSGNGLVLLLGEHVDALDHVVDEAVLRVPNAAPVGDVDAVNNLGVLAAGAAGLAVEVAGHLVDGVEADGLDQSGHEDVHTAAEARADVAGAAGERAEDGVHHERLLGAGDLLDALRRITFKFFFI
jgi:hypothetical protein